MKKLPARIIADNRITIPEEFREQYDLERGDRVWVTVEPIEDAKTRENTDLLGV